MKMWMSLMLAALFSLPVTAFCKEPVRVLEGTVTKVSDGDTIHIKDGNGSKVKVRLYGIDAPETEKKNHRTGKISKPGQPFGDKAFESLRAKIDRKHVRVEVMDIDRYKRAVSIIWCDGRDINREMVKEGLAWAYRQYLDRPHASEYIGAEEQARTERRGLWQQSNPQPPWEFRRGLRIKGQ